MNLWTEFCALCKTTGAEPLFRTLYNLTGGAIPYSTQRNSDGNVNQKDQDDDVKNKVPCYERERRVPYCVVFKYHI